MRYTRHTETLRQRHTPPQRTPINKRKNAYLVRNGCASDGWKEAGSRWDIYTVVNGQREYHHTGKRLSVVVAFAVQHGLRIVDENNTLSRVWEVEDDI